jgi:hypothetical protein
MSPPLEGRQQWYLTYVVEHTTDLVHPSG